MWIKYILRKSWLISACASSNTLLENKNVNKSKSTRWWVATQVMALMLKISVTQMFLELNLFLIITALDTQWMIDHLAHAQVLEKGESEHSPHLPCVSHWRWDVSQINLFLHLMFAINQSKK